MSNSSLPKKTDLPSPAEVDELGALQAWLALNKSKIDREEELRKQFAAAYDDAPADQDFQVEGDKFIVIIPVRQKRRRIKDMKKLFKVLGSTIFFKICDVTLGKMEALTDESQRKALIDEDRTGPRSPVKAVPKAA